MKKVIYYFIILLASCSPSQENLIDIHSNSKVYKIFYTSNRIYLKCQVNDTIPGNFLFDTGCYGIYYDSIFGLQNKLIYYNNSVSPLKNNSLHERPYEQRKQILLFEDVKYFTSIAELANLKSMDGRQIDGIIGWDLFDKKMVEFNFINSYVKVHAYNDTVIESSFKKIPLKQTEDGFLVKAEIDINDSLKITGDFILDFGCTGEVLLNHSTVENYKIKEKVRNVLSVNSRYGNLLGKTSVFHTRVKKVLLDDFLFIDPIISCSDNDDGVLENRSFIGVIGMRVLERFDIIIDFKRHFIYFRKNKKFSNRFKYISAGLYFVDRTDITEGWIVNFIVTNEQADKAGIKNGDLITHINNIDVKTLSCDSVRQSLREVGITALFTIKQGKTNKKVSLIAKEYLKK